MSKKKGKKERKKYLISFYFLYCVGLHYNDFFFLFHDWRSNTVHTMPKLQITQGRYDGAMEMKSKLYLRIILLINYMMEENLFVYVECSSVKHAASRFSVRKNVTKKKTKREWHLDGLISQVQVLSVFYPEVLCTTLYRLYIIL